MKNVLATTLALVLLMVAGCSTSSTTSGTRSLVPTGRGKVGPWPLDTARSCEVLNIGPAANTAGSESAPAVGAGGLTIYFVSNRSGGSGGSDFWLTTKWSRYDTSFAPAENLRAPLNSAGNEEGLAVAPTGGTICFSSCGRAGGMGDCDLYQGRIVGEQNVLDITPLRALNSQFSESYPAFGADGTELYFASNRPATLKTPASGNDLFVSTRSADGTWSAPRRLGAAVNTPAFETSPCITMKGSLLLFTSNRPGGYGGYDVYGAWRLEDGTWGTSFNIGPLINTPADERSVAATSIGDVLYVASKREDMRSGGDLDLYMVRPLDP